MASRSVAGVEHQFLRELGEFDHSKKADLDNQLLRLQWAQLQHDQSYHADIAILPVGERIKHFALHMAKYVGYIATTVDSEDKNLLRRTLVDAFIIALACANSLSIDLGKAIACEDAPLTGLSAIGESALAEFPKIATDHVAFLKLLARHTGRLAKACESLDHVENHPFREAMSSAVVELFRLIVAKGLALEIDLAQKRHERLKEIESTSMFNKYR